MKLLAEGSAGPQDLEHRHQRRADEGLLEAEEEGPADLDVALLLGQVGEATRRARVEDVDVALDGVAGCELLVLHHARLEEGGALLRGVGGEGPVEALHRLREDHLLHQPSI